MPYINLKTTKMLTPENCENLKSAFGKAIECFPGKTENWLMVGLEDGARLWFKGDASQDSAIVDVELLGNVSKESSETMTVKVCNILQKELGISPDRVYVKYKGYADWGWNNMNF
ncbi:MAG: hypothetical protein IJ025_02075 [Clostridia bacterium]|nr:hypothetical protein [Clostridia bacterium]